MHIPKHWVRVSEKLQGHETEAFGWSDESVADAERQARSRATRVLRWLIDHEAGVESGADPRQRYGYGDDRPLREPLVKTLETDGLTIITRNAYGALVLNTAEVCFIDVDLPEPKRGIVGLLAAAFSRRKEDPAAVALSRIRETAQIERLGLRVYRTAAGFRCLVMNALFDPVARATDALLDRFGCDPRYRSLCRVQRCFRARLTPKPWRCGVREPVWPWPFRSREHERAHASWLREYERAAAAYAVCSLVESLGPVASDPSVAAAIGRVQREHDAHCLRSHPAPLA